MGVEERRDELTDKNTGVMMQRLSGIERDCWRSAECGRCGDRRCGLW